jgi:hypothetical protein
LVDLIARVERGGGGGGVKKGLREKRKERKETKDRGQAPHISNSHATTSNRELIKERTECSRNINPYNDTPRSPRDVEPNNNRKNNQS